jgi:hypothetical protein
MYLSFINSLSHAIHLKESTCLCFKSYYKHQKWPNFRSPPTDLGAGAAPERRSWKVWFRPPLKKWLGDLLPVKTRQWKNMEKRKFQAVKQTSHEMMGFSTATLDFRAMMVPGCTSGRKFQKTKGYKTSTAFRSVCSLLYCQ